MVINLSLAAADERLVGSNVDVRTILGFSMPIDTVRALLPAGWDADVAGIGPGKDINLRVTFIETLVNRDAKGDSLAPARIAHLSVPAGRKGGMAGVTMLVVAFSTGGSGGPYGNSIRATAEIERRIRYGRPAAPVVDEHWRFRTSHGDELDLELRFSRGELEVRESVDEIHSAAEPARYRVYRSEHAVDRLRDAQADRIERIAFKASGPMLSPLFAGPERLASVLSLPFYSRRVYAPDSAPQPPAQT